MAILQTKPETREGNRRKANMARNGKTAILTTVGFAVAIMFLLPYIRMMFTAVTPADEVYKIPATIFHQVLSGRTS